MMKAHHLITAALLLSLASQARAQSTDKQLAADVDSLIKQVLAATGVPNLAIAVVKDDRPVLLKGYGYADVERKIPATENTIYYIASCTKAFTGLTVALMADRGLVNLDAPISRYLKGVKWGAGVNPDSISLRRLLTHTHGIENSGPVTWRTAFTGEHTDALLKELLQYHPATDLGHTYRYTNLGYNILGLMIDDLTHGKWQDAIQTYVSKPLGMTNTTSYISRFDSAQLAMPYTLEPDGMRRLIYAKKDANMQSAGGLVTTAADMAKWLEMQINLGKLDGKQVFPQRVVAETQKLQVPTSQKRGDNRMQIGYGFGWGIETLNGDTVRMHGGGFSSLATMIGFSPKYKVGVAVMSTERTLSSGLVDYIAQYVLDRAADPQGAQQRVAQRLTQIPQVVERMKAAVTNDRARRAARPQNLARPLTAYTGTFVSQRGGTMFWSVRNGKLWLQHGVLESPVEVFDNQKEVFRAELEPGQGEVFTFKFEGDRAVSVMYDDREYVRSNL